MSAAIIAKQSHLSEARALAQEARLGFRLIRNSSIQERNQILQNIQDLLGQPKKISYILEENQKDLQLAEESGVSPSMQERLLLNEKRLENLRQSVEHIIELPDPINQVSQQRKLANGISLQKRSTPLGVFFVIYESRPNVTVDVALMSIKSANAVILRGGKEARNSNRALYRAIILEAFAGTRFDSGNSSSDHSDRSNHSNHSIVRWVENNDRDFMKALLLQSETIDLVIPRGGEHLIRFVSEHSRIPVIKHDKGVCNLFIDETADLDMALAIAANAKLQRPSVCNAVENLLLHKDFPKLEELLQGLHERGVQLLGDESVAKIYDKVRVIESEKLAHAYAQEFLDERLSVIIVADDSEAMRFIEKYGSGHSEAIVSKNQSNCRRFEQEVDAAAIFVNCSTRFHDGGEMGFGAEIGISTTRIHARGPMGLKDLTSNNYLLVGEGQIREN